MDTTGFEEDARLTAMWLWTLGAAGDDDGAQKKSNFSEKLDFSAQPLRRPRWRPAPATPWSTTPRARSPRAWARTWSSWATWWRSRAATPACCRPWSAPATSSAWKASSSQARRGKRAAADVAVRRH
ncbi:MAG: hypothetical protein V9H69_17610 [Anaerolineae bacterium]